MKTSTTAIPRYGIAMGRMFALVILVAAASFTSLAARRTLKNSPQASAPSRITVASGVRVRVAPQLTAEERGTLQLGVVVRELERSASRERIGAKEDYWYRIEAPGGPEGWVFGGLTARFDAARGAEIYRDIAAERLKPEEASFADRSDLVIFLERVVPEAGRGNLVAELELMRLLALQKSLASIPVEKLEEPQYAAWVKAQEPHIVYSEPAGQWFVRSELFWNLQQKYSARPVAERIAWEAAQNPLPGECEGYLPCYLASYGMRHVRYLKLYPDGAHAAAAVDDIAQFVAGVVEDASGQKVYEVPAEDRAEFQKSLAELRAVVSKVTHPKRATLLRQLDETARRFRR